MALKSDMKKSTMSARIEGPDLTDEMESIVHAWLAIKTETGDRTECHRLFDSYWRYCKEKSLLCLSYRNFMRVMRRKFKWVPAESGISYVGVRLK